MNDLSILGKHCGTGLILGPSFCEFRTQHDDKDKGPTQPHVCKDAMDN